MDEKWHCEGSVWSLDVLVLARGNGCKGRVLGILPRLLSRDCQSLVFLLASLCLDRCAGFGCWYADFLPVWSSGVA